MRILLTLCTLVLSLNTMAKSGSEVGNGGDTIFCKPSHLNSFNGYYTLDFLLEYQTQKPISLKEESFEAYKTYIRTNLKRVYPEILPQFDDFFNALKNGESFNRVWESSVSKLKDIKDENIIRKIPENCLLDGKPQLIQTVIRKNLSGKINYKFDKNILDLQKEQSPLQYSFFMIHEWMWDSTRDVRVLRKINWFFHSQEFSEISREDFLKKLDQWELFTPKLSYCHRSAETQSYYNIDCSKTTSRDLKDIKSLHYINLYEQFLFPIGEFYGFSRVESLTIDRSNLKVILNPRLFSPLYSLKKLSLTNGRLVTLSSETLRDLTKLEILDIQGNNDFVLKSNFCDSLQALKVLKLSSDSKVECLPKNIEELYFDSRVAKEKLDMIKAFNSTVKVLYSNDF